MSVATSIRTSVRNLINNLGSTAYLYSFSSATKSYNSEGDVDVSDWGGATTIKVISTNNYVLRRLLSMQGEENNQSDRNMFIRDDVTVSQKDKVTIDSTDYEVVEVENFNPIQDTKIIQKIVLSINDKY